MRFMKVLALVVGIVLLIPVSVLLIGVVFQSLRGAVATAAAVFIILPCVVAGCDRYETRKPPFVRQPTPSPDQATSRAFSRMRMAGVTAWVGPDDELRETPRYSDHILTGGPAFSAGLANNHR